MAVILRQAFSAALLLVMCLTILQVQAAEDWEFTPAEKRRCETVRIGTQFLPYQITLPRGATFTPRGTSILLDGKVFFSVNPSGNSSAAKTRDYALRLGQKIVAYQRDLVAVDAGPIDGYYFYLFYSGKQRGAAKGVVAFSSSIPTLEDCLFRIKCAKTLQRIDTEMRSKGGEPAVAGGPAAAIKPARVAGASSSVTPARGDIQSAAEARNRRPDPRGDRPFVVTGTERKETIDCQKQDVIVTGRDNEVTIRGHCGKLTVTGTGNRVTMEVVAKISVTGRDNSIAYLRGADGEPEITGIVKLNDIRQRKSRADD